MKKVFSSLIFVVNGKGKEKTMEHNNWTIPDLLQLSGGYWAACALHAGVKLDIFSPLAEG